eukprot:365705-Chlamydomonas_euryale.AAC.3
MLGIDEQGERGGQRERSAETRGRERERDRCEADMCTRAVVVAVVGAAGNHGVRGREREGGRCDQQNAWPVSGV